MPKLSFMKWYPADWINDTRELSPEAKAAWIDMLCLMWNAPARGTWKGTYQEFARATGLPWEIAPRVVTELSHKVSRVTIRDSEVTLENRRMVNQETHYNDHAKRQRDYRVRRECDKKVTDKTLDSSIVLKTSQDNNNPPSPPPGGAFDLVWNRYPSRTGRKAAERSFKVSVKTAVDFLDIQNALANYLRSERVAKGFVQNGSTWFNNWRDWINYTEVKNAPHGSTSPDYYASVARRAKAAQGLRKVSSPGEILAGLRVVPDVSPGAEDGSGAGFPADGRPLGPVGKDIPGH